MGRELEIELGSVQCRTSEAYKAFQKAERRVKELQFQQDEDHKNQDRMSELANKLQAKLKKLLPSTWPNTARPNKDLKKLRRELRWLVPKWPVLALLSKLTTANYQL